MMRGMDAGANDQQITDNNQQTPLGSGSLGGQATPLSLIDTTGGQAAVSHQQQPFNSQQPMTSGQQLGVNGQDIGVGSEQTAVIGSQPSAPSHQPLVADQQQATPQSPGNIGGGQVSGNDQYSITNDQQPTVSDRQQAVINNQPSPVNHHSLTDQHQGAIVQQTQVSGDKERVELGSRADVSERVPLVEIREDHEFEPEVEGWLEKLQEGHEVKLPEPVKHEGEVLVADASAQVVKEKLVLPMTQTGISLGLKARVTSGARWLAEWCSRLIKMFGDQVQYRQSQPKTQ